jgi:hypothetical protein
MEHALLDWLARVGSSAFRYSALAFVVVNGAAIAAVVMTRDRSLVNRWTGRVLAANLLLAGTGLGVPLVTTVSRLGSWRPPSIRVIPVVGDQGRDEAIESSPLQR